MTYWISAVKFFGKQLNAGPVMVANVRFWSFNPSGRSLNQFVANTASSRMLRWHIAETEALELESPLLSIYSLRGLYGLAIPWEPLAHTRLVLTPLDAADGRSCEKFHLGYLPCRSVHWQWYFFWRYCTFFQPPNLSSLWSKKKKVFSAKDLMLSHGEALMVLLPCHFFLLGVFGRNPQGHYNNLEILFLDCKPNAMQ